DIQLPDSTNNEPESHGLVSFKITPLPDLPVGTVLENTAYIYFDNNEPIITNTTWTTIHECGGEAEFVSETALVCDEVQVNFDSSYPWVERYSWEILGEEVSAESEHTIVSPAEDQYEMVFTATNSLCEETSSQVYEVTPADLLDPCLADFNCDGKRDSEDLLQFLSDYGCAENCQGDFSGNGIVDVDDLLVFLTLFSRDCWE
ncbi:MAG: hypothetical protein AAF193_11550, partial [Bacteroidota bacterium]